MLQQVDRNKLKWIKLLIKIVILGSNPHEGYQKESGINQEIGQAVHFFHSVVEKKKDDELGWDIMSPKLS